MRGYPALSQIAAFDAAARHLSFSRAATELNVQQPAVSRQIAALEADLGHLLFQRSKPRLRLTPEGEMLATAVTDGLGAIRRTIDALRGQKRRDVLVVNAAIGFTSFFLLPRLGEFQSAHPDIRVEVVTRDQNPDYDPTACDIVVTFGEAPPPGTESRPIFGEELVAVCAPGRIPAGRHLGPEELVRERLLHMSSGAHASDWDRFLAGTGLSPPEPQPIDRLFSYMVYLRAIQNGQGIGLGWRHLVDDLLASGALVQISDRIVVTPRAYHCSILPHSEMRANARIFLNWIGALVPPAGASPATGPGQA